jgi:hypothetical protein
MGRGGGVIAALKGGATTLNREGRERHLKGGLKL